MEETVCGFPDGGGRGEDSDCLVNDVCCQGEGRVAQTAEEGGV